MWTRLLLAVTITIAGLYGPQPAVQASEQEHPTLTLTDALYLPTVEGADAELAAGTYQVGPMTDTSVTLIGTDPSRPQVFQATVVEHDFPVSELTALLVTGDDDSRHLVLLIPEGKAWDVVGTATGIRSRAVTLRPFNSAQLAAAVMQRPAATVLAPSSMLRERMSPMLQMAPPPRVSLPIQTPTPTPAPSGSTPSRGPGGPGIFLSIDGIVGESQNSGHRGWMLVQAITWGSAQALPPGGGAVTGRPPLSIVTISKLLDTASPLLAVAVADGRHMNTATIDFVGPAPGMPYAIMTLNDVVVTGYTVSGSAGPSLWPQESITLTFSRGEWTVGNARGLMNTTTKP
jgi:type VI secretion system secreted protein Hcp